MLKTRNYLTMYAAVTAETGGSTASGVQIHAILIKFLF